MEPTEVPELTVKERYDLILQRANEHLIDFSIAVNPEYVAHWHLDLIAAELEKIEELGDRDYKVLLIQMPPRHGKSELCTVNFPAWYLGRNPTKEIITVSYSADLAQDFGAKTRGIVSEPAYKAIFNVSLKEDEQGKAKWKTNENGSYTSVGVGGSVTGRGANILIFDDPIKNRVEAESETYRQRVWDFFTSTAFTRLEPKGVAVVILTRWHMDDLAGRILMNEGLKGKVKIIHLPAIATQTEENRKVGEALWPERYTVEYFETITKPTLGPYDWEALYQGSPILTESQEFRKEWYKYIDENELEQKQTANFLTVDTAISKRDYADYTGFCDNSVDSENFWNLKAWRIRLNPDELVNTLFALHERRRYAAIGIEKTTFTEGLKPYLDSEQRRRGRFLPIVELSHKNTAKDIRIRSLIPRYAAGGIRHVKGLCDALELELSQFPHGLHDDVCDSVSYMSQIADMKLSHEVTVSRPKSYRSPLRRT
ncbi:MAG: terminase family protein [Candidatus Paceibacterota bacterium]